MDEVDVMSEPPEQQCSPTIVAAVGPVDAERAVRHSPSEQPHCLDNAPRTRDVTSKARADDVDCRAGADEAFDLMKGRRRNARHAEGVWEAVEDAHVLDLELRQRGTSLHDLVEHAQDGATNQRNRALSRPKNGMRYKARLTAVLLARRCS